MEQPPAMLTGKASIARHLLALKLLPRGDMFPLHAHLAGQSSHKATPSSRGWWGSAVLRQAWTESCGASLWTSQGLSHRSSFSLGFAHIFALFSKFILVILQCKYISWYAYNHINCNIYYNQKETKPGLSIKGHLQCSAMCLFPIVQGEGYTVYSASERGKASPLPISISTPFCPWAQKIEEPTA